MIRLRSLLLAVITISLFACEKEYSVENAANNGSNEIIGIDCRISKIIYTDTATKSGIGSIEAVINAVDVVTRVTRFDSISNTIEFIGTPTYSNDTVFLNQDEYFVVDANKRINRLHGLTDPTDPFSLQFDVFYLYNAAGYLVTKNYFLTSNPTIAFYRVDYTYTNGNLTRMTGTDLSNGDLFIDADISYFSNIIPKRFIYIFPDETAYANYTQFFNFGLKSFNGVRRIVIRNYDPGNVVRDSLVTNFSNYGLSRDAYVVNVQMAGDDLQCIPAAAGKLSFSYKCK